ncbi:hypothetical protein BU26DRAFT_565291 [Trematosphaeria pertusa]|uniref:BYS1 domain protein n=1 Tax=Trematosphaeria pertusa TaxID=390896 RepID=A0A6A6IBV0_9PLEO|nr:uncharacterized protein BU26DRAFT_565291 [Trematosphaeria pertusa]KAF2247861.1 hypothetical protein BU26DRAFT_565291 [Trematosphaeria pertusa]
MRLTTLTTALALCASSTLAAPTGSTFAIVKNHCSFPIWITSVSNSAKPVVKVPASGNWVEPEYFDGTGTSIQIVTSDGGFYSDAPILNFGYTYNENSVYYDLNSIKGFSFSGQKITLGGGSNGDVPVITWDGAPPGHQDTRAYFAQTDLVLDLCAA